MSDELLYEGERIDDLQCKGLKIIQDPEKFCFGIDAVLLSNYAKASKGDKVLDLGTGTGIIPILMSGKTDAGHFTAVEIQKESADMASRSVVLNNLTDKIEIICKDVKELNDVIDKASFDVVTSNPPYMVGSHGITNDSEYMAIARHEIKCNLEDIVKAAADALKPGGYFYMVHRPFRLSEILVMLTKYRIEPKKIRLVHPYADKEPNMVLIEAKRGAKSGVIVEKPLVVYDSPGVYTKEVLEIYGRDVNEG